MTVTRTHKSGGLDALAARMVELEKLGATMEVGIFGERRHPRGKRPKLSQLLAWHEFGTKTIPARRPIRSYTNGKGPAEIAARSKVVLPAVLRGETPIAEGLASIGGVAVAGVRAGIMARLPPPLVLPVREGRHPALIPLFDTGSLYRAIAVRIGGKVTRV